MRLAIYHLLVNRHAGISYRYHKCHDGTTGLQKIASWFYLLLLNFAYYILLCRFLGRKPQMEVYESRRLNCKKSESEAYLEKNPQLSVDAYVEKLKAYDVISFDLFDTLIFRPFALPTDVFFLVGGALGCLDFKNLRVRAEEKAREEQKKQYGHCEVTLADIWQMLEKETGISARDGMREEERMERQLCYANPFMLEVWRSLLRMGKQLLIVSDMYLPFDCIAAILENTGFEGAEKVYLSHAYKKSKADGFLYEEVLKDWPQASLIHVGDNPHSDRDMAKRYGLAVLPYAGIYKNVMLYRPMDMSAMIGSAYRAVVSSRLYNGLCSYSMEYEYGYFYGGLFVVGYCNFIHEYYERQGLDKLLFLSRDGDILLQAYRRLHPEDEAAYVYWSRKAAAKLTANLDKHDYFRRFVYHKVNQGYTVAQILHSMELDRFLEWLGGCEGREQADKEDIFRQKTANRHKGEQKGLKAGDELTDKNADLFQEFVEEHWDQVIAVYATQLSAAEKYYAKVLEGCGHAAAVDIGWAGSGALALSHLTEKVWNIPCQITGLIAGTNTVHSAEPDASEIFLQSGKLCAYLYSQSHNRDLLKKHDPNKEYNVYWELLLSSPTPQFTGFYEGRMEASADGESARYLEELDITLAFGKQEDRLEGIREIQKGILDFVDDYYRRFKEFPYMFRVSGRDAYAPMLAAASHHERYLKAILKKFTFEKNIV